MSGKTLTPRVICELGPAWAASSANVSAFRCEGLVTAGGAQAGAFYGPDGQVVVFRRSLAGGTVATVEIPPAGPDALPWDAHRSISVGIDGRYAIHLAYGAHASALTSWRGGPEMDLSCFSPAQPDLGHAAQAVTYPSFVRLGDPPVLAMLYREGVPDGGALKCRIFDEARGEWADREQPLLDGRGQRPPAGPYLNRPLVTAGGTLLAFLVWRLRLPGSGAGKVINAGLDLVAFRAGLETVETMSGLVLPRPAGTAHTERVVAVPLGSDLMNQAGAALSPSGEPAAITWWREPAEDPPQFRLVYRHQGCWRAAPVSAFKTDFSLSGLGTLPLPHSRPQLLFAPDGRAIVIFRSAEFSGHLMAQLLRFADGAVHPVGLVTLWPEDLGYYEPVIDVEAWHCRQRLSMFVQWCGQQRGDHAGATQMTAPCRVLEWDMADLLAA